MTAEREQEFEADGFVYHGSLDELNARKDMPHQYEFVKGQSTYTIPFRSILIEGQYSFKPIIRELSGRGVDGIVNGSISVGGWNERNFRTGEDRLWAQGTPVVRKGYKQSQEAKPSEKIDLNGLTMGQIEQIHIEKTLEQAQGNRLEAAKILGIKLRTLNEKLRKYMRS